ncbi:histone deacetylase 9-like [Quercus suber]|uniref:histone deacetylase 9-like n=1 Tax=Quercus suber TaxID=58331 RepID=UPI0032DE6E5A
MRSKDKIAYYYDGDVGGVYFGPNHPMKPHRLCMTHHLVLSYDLHKKMEIYRPHKAYPVELAQFHSADYVEFLHRITPDTQHLFSNELAKCPGEFLLPVAWGCCAVVLMFVNATNQLAN